MPDITPEDLNLRSVGVLPGLLGVVVTRLAPREVRAELAIHPGLHAPDGTVHPGSLVTLAETACGYACATHLPQGAIGFRTVELNSSHLAAAAGGTLDCEVQPTYLGRDWHHWGAVVRHRESGRPLALVRATVRILYTKGSPS